MRTPALVAHCLLTLSLGAQTPPDLAKILAFELAPSSTGSPGGWFGGPPKTLFADDKVFHGGQFSGRMERTADSPDVFSALTLAFPIRFTGKSVELRGYLRSENVSQFFGLWLREDDETRKVVEFENMQSLALKGTNDWKQYSITLPLNSKAKILFMGAFLSGSGKVWADDFEVLVDGKPVWQAPVPEAPKTVLDTDKAFDGGSGISGSELTANQVNNLVTLGKVWGYLKYHHPRVTAGEHHWDYELFRILPAVLAAADAGTANGAIHKWLSALGPRPPCKPCSQLSDNNLHLRPELDWLGDTKLLGAELSRSLLALHGERAIGDQQFYVAMVPGIGNPVLKNEADYPKLKLPDPGFQILALYRFWNIIEYWFPYRDQIGTADWDQTLREFLPRLFAVKDRPSYELELIALIARVHDTHANLWNGLKHLPPVGDCALPYHFRFIEGQAVVVGLRSSDTTLQVGDVIPSLDGRPVGEWVKRWSSLYAASNEPTRLRDIAHNLGRGACGEAVVQVRRAGAVEERKVLRVPPTGLTPPLFTNDRPGEAFQMLSPEVAYLKFSNIKSGAVAGYIDAAKDTKGLVLDLRNYPSAFMPFELGSLLVSQPTPFVIFTKGDVAEPGAFRWTPKPLEIQPAKPHYSGRIVILVDEVTQSQAEYTAMAFRAVPGAIVVGSTTAGADGNVSYFSLPGGLRSMVSGIGIFYPDKRPTQRVGIVPDIVARPTIEGIRAGRDEVLEVALRRILGPDTPAASIEKLAAPAKP